MSTKQKFYILNITWHECRFPVETDSCALCVQQCILGYGAPETLLPKGTNMQGIMRNKSVWSGFWAYDKQKKTVACLAVVYSWQIQATVMAVPCSITLFILKYYIHGRFFMLEIFAVNCVLRVSLLMKCFISQGNTSVPHTHNQNQGLTWQSVVSSLLMLLASWCFGAACCFYECWGLTVIRFLFFVD